jgi:hypothetical protein
MAVNSSRSQRMSLEEGATDGKYRKVAPDTEPGPDRALTLRDRASLHSWYNYGEITSEYPREQRSVPGAL